MRWTRHRTSWAVLITALAVWGQGAEATSGPQANGAPTIERVLEHTLLTAATENHGKTFAAGDRGQVFTKTSSEWSAAVTSTRRLLTGITSLDPTHAWAVGHDAVILHSEDDGQNWAMQYSDPEAEAPLFGIWFDTPKHGIAYGAYGMFLETEDGGTNWSQRSLSEDGPHHYSLTESPAGSLYVAGEFGSIFRSGDRGDSWAPLESPYSGTYFGVLALRDEAVLAFGLRGNLFRSEDFGQTWTKLETGTSGSLLGATELKNGGVLIVGLGGVMLKSRDGRHFDLQVRKDRLGHSTVIESGSQILLFGEEGVREWQPW